MKALSVFVTVKIKIVLLLLFIGGGIFYGLKIWQGTALGCPEPIIQEIVKNHHDIHDTILPYHGHISHDEISSYPGPSSYGNGFDLSGVYSNTPSSSSYSGPSYLPPSSSGGASPTSYSGGSYLPPSDSYAAAPPSASDGSGSYSKRKSSTGRQISEESQTIFSDLIFRFLGVNTDECRRRFVCELEFRNPFLGYATRYIGQVYFHPLHRIVNNSLIINRVELFKEYVTPKNAKSSPKKFADCGKLYSECKAPNEQPIGLKKRRKQLKDKNVTTTPAVEETTLEVDIVTEYVKQRKI